MVDIGVLVAFVFLTVYLISVFVPMGVNFTYKSQYCTADLNFFPDVNRQLNGDKFEVSYHQYVSICDWKIASFQTCFTAREAVDDRTYLVSPNMYGNIFTTRDTLNKTQHQETKKKQ